MSKGTGVFAIACWCLAAAAANAQYGPVLNGQPGMGSAVPPSADYYNNFNAYQRQLAANAPAPPVAPGYYTPANGGWAVEAREPGQPRRQPVSPTTWGVTTWRDSTIESRPADSGPARGTIPRRFVERKPTSVPNFEDPANTSVIGPGNLVPNGSNGQPGNFTHPGMSGNFGQQGVDPAFGNSGGCASGNCGSGNCGSPCGLRAAKKAAAPGGWAPAPCSTPAPTAAA